jgi:poly-gamma-glutamate synthesis protein (capsule biosynthesis protein)
MKKDNQLLKTICLGMVLILPSFLLSKHSNNVVSINTEPSITSSKDNSLDNEEITLSFVGDCTIGTDNNFGYSRSFTDVFNKNNKDFDYFFRGVESILANDDLTIANLETTFTNATKKRVKQFNFKGDPSYVNILLEGSVEVVNLANNHTYDYLEKGYNDTIATLKDANVDYYGNSVLLIKEVKGIKIGFAGFMGFNGVKSTCVQIDKAMKYFNDNNVDIKIVSFHWGIEREHYFNSNQETLGKYSIDKGANLVIGHHPHVLQGIQEYKNAYIVYSLGNFVFGGNKNPSDKDAMIFQQTFKFENDKLVGNSIKIIPVSISSKTNQNDYQPTILESQNKVKVLTRINQYSKNFIYNGEN